MEEKMTTPSYSIVIPAYNEADKIASTLTQVLGFMKNFAPNFEIIIVDDGSLDSTRKIVEDFQVHYEQINLIRNQHKGKSYAVWTGVMQATKDLVYLADADLSTPITELKKLSIWITDQGYDVVIASREGTGAARIDEPFYRHFVGRIFNMWVQLIALPGIKDSQCGFKLFRKFTSKDIFERLKVYGPKEKETSKPFFGAFDVEVLFIARKLKYKIKEVPVTWVFVKTTRFNFLHNSLRMALDVLKIRVNDMQGAYKTL